MLIIIWCHNSYCVSEASTLLICHKVSFRSCDWWDCIPWVDTNSWLHVVVGFSYMLTMYLIYLFLLIFNIFLDKYLTYFHFCISVAGYWILLISPCQWKRSVCLLLQFSLLMRLGPHTFWQRSSSCKSFSPCIIIFLWEFLLWFGMFFLYNLTPVSSLQEVKGTGAGLTAALLLAMVA